MVVNSNKQLGKLSITEVQNKKSEAQSEQSQARAKQVQAKAGALRAQQDEQNNLSQQATNQVQSEAASQAATQLTGQASASTAAGKASLAAGPFGAAAAAGFFAQAASFTSQATQQTGLSALKETASQTAAGRAAANAGERAAFNAADKETGGKLRKAQLTMSLLDQASSLAATAQTQGNLMGNKNLIGAAQAADELAEDKGLGLNSSKVVGAEKYAVGAGIGLYAGGMGAGPYQANDPTKLFMARNTVNAGLSAAGFEGGDYADMEGYSDFLTGGLTGNGQLMGRGALISGLDMFNDPGFDASDKDIKDSQRKNRMYADFAVGAASHDSPGGDDYMANGILGAVDKNYNGDRTTFREDKERKRDERNNGGSSNTNKIAGA